MPRSIKSRPVRERERKQSATSHKNGSAMGAVKVSTSVPRWMKSAELADAIRQTRDIPDPLVAAGPEELRNATRRWSCREFSFIDSAKFEHSNAGDQIFAQSSGLNRQDSDKGLAATRKKGVDLPVHLSRLCEAPLLNPEQERLLFQRMNFLMHQATLHQKALNISRPSRARLQRIRHLCLLADWHRDRIVESNVRLVFSIVKKFVNPNNSFDDLLSDGIVGLMKAIEKFDYERGFRFSTYATQVVRRNSYRTVMENQEDRQRFMDGLQEADIVDREEERSSAISEKRWHELRGRLSVMMHHLDRRERLIIRARFSLGPHRKVHTLQSLADRLKISKERVRQLEGRAVNRLRQLADDVPVTQFES